AANCTELIRSTLTLSRYRRTQIGSWQKSSTSLGRSRPCLRYTGKCSGKVQILLQCALDHGNKLGIVETSPPGVQLWRRQIRLNRLGSIKIVERSSSDNWSSIVWTHRMPAWNATGQGQTKR